MAEVKTTSSEQGAKTSKIVKAKRSERKAKGGTTAWSKFLTLLQELGKTLQFPIAMLPFAAILNRFGALGIQYTSMTDNDGVFHITNQVGYWISFIIQKPGGVAFDNLPLMFAIGVAFGLAKDHRGEVALVGALFYLILAAMTGAAGTLPEMIYKNVLTFNANPNVINFTADQISALNSSIADIDALKNMTVDQITDLTKTTGLTVGQLADIPFMTGLLNWSHNLATGAALNYTWGDAASFSSLFYVPVKDGASGIVTGSAYVLNIGVLGGIVAGGLSAFLYNRLKDIKLPTALSFFGGRRFVPMVAMVASIGVALIFAIVWPWIQWVLMKMGQAVADPENPAVAVPGTMLYAFLNRILLPFGLHQILNTLFWFQLPVNGDVIKSFSGEVMDTNKWVNGDINAFTAGISTAGLFQSGFFPVMMGGVPAIAVAMIFTAKKENRKQVAGFLGGVAAVAFLSGITEPVEFSFVFLSPLLLVIHAGLTAIFVGITTGMHIQVGFGFSAGLIDYCISFAQSWGMANHATGVYHVTSNPLWILPLAALAGVVWFFVFYFSIKGLKVMTPGREDVIEQSATANEGKDAAKGGKAAKGSKSEKYEAMAQKIVDTIGMDNFESVDNCATRLRLVVKDNTTFEDAPIKATGAFGVKRLGTQGVQIVIGPDVEHVANIVKRITNK
jgi:PTS system N-acetylglucosamine-specific IIC component